MRHCILVPKMLLIVVFSVGLTSQGTTIPDRVADARGKPLTLRETTDTRPVPLAKLAAAELIVVGKLTRLKSYLSENKYYVYTDYELTPKQVVTDRAGRLTPKTPGATPPLIVSIYGGELDVNGTPVRIEDSSLGQWDADTDLLLFLARNQHDPAKFRLYAGSAGLFQVERGTQRVKSLLNHWDKDRDVRDQALDQIVQRVRVAKP